MGYQGSYGRGEAAEDSDIGIVVVLDKLAPQGLAVYRELAMDSGVSGYTGEQTERAYQLLISWSGERLKGG